MWLTGLVTGEGTLHLWVIALKPALVRSHAEPASPFTYAGGYQESGGIKEKPASKNSCPPSSRVAWTFLTAPHTAQR